jgi:hypothetical protein
VPAILHPARSDPRYVRAADLYKQLAETIQPYRTLKEKTGEFNRLVRELHQLGLGDAEYVGLRLDAHHIVENTWYKAFAKEFQAVFQWSSGADMDAIALHTELHIRSGDNMAQNLGLLGAEGYSSLTKSLQDFLEKDKARSGGAFRSVHELFEAHERFYRLHQQKYWPRLQSWFLRRKGELRGRLR